MPLAVIAVALACARAPAAGPRAAARLWIGGDVFLGAAPAGLLAGVASVEKGRAGVINLEGPVGAAAAPGGGIRLVQPPAALEELRRAGVKVALIANNHAQDAGPGGDARTAEAARGAGLVPAGGPAGIGLLEGGGVRIAVTAHDLTPGVPAALGGELAAARARADVLIATFHVTGPPLYRPRPELEAAVEIALAAGAAVVAAEGTHALGKVERRGGAVIAWGLGNLVMACGCTDETDGALLEVDLDGQGAPGAAVVPVEAGLQGHPASAAAEDATGIYELLERLGSSPLRPEGPRARF
ncbi:MAG TPA: CapA family protein [Myxococcales bacterium]|nr:CapA family protein [Myxococcales bacterium]